MVRMLRSRIVSLLPGVAALLAGCAPDGGPDSIRASVATHCIDCHNDAERAGNLTLERRDFAALGSDAEVWELAIRKLSAGMMPPADGPVLDSAERAALVGSLKSALDAAAAANPNPGRTVPFHRLNRTEYRNAIRDLLAIDIDLSERLPADDSSYGFDNIAGVLKVSPTLLERYLAVADELSRLAVGLPAPFENIDYFRVPDDRSQEARLPGLPFGTRGGMKVDYLFPVDGQYTIAVDLARDLNEQVPLYAEAHTLEVSIDGEQAATFTLPAVPRTPPPEENRADPGISQLTARLRLSRDDRALRNRIDDDWNVTVPVKAGQRTVVATFIAHTAALDETPRLPFERPFPAGVNIPETRKGAYLRGIEISGPYAVGARPEAATSQSRQRVFVCEPAAGDAAAERSCASEILATLAGRAFRRPAGDDEVAALLAFFDEGRASASFDEGIRLALKRLLVAPEFLFRVEREPAGLPPGTAYELDGYSLASRLSFFLWSSLPDDELLAAAASGALGSGEGLAVQVARMIADPRADAFIENFAGQWLFLRNLDAIVPVQSYFPDFDDTLRQGLRRETELLFGDVLRSGGTVRDLLTSDYTFVNERVARHYGIRGISGSHFRRIELAPATHRSGLLGHGSILTVTSYPDRTSPVIRGKWLLENLLGTPPPAPPPDVPGLVETDGAGTELSMRERLAAHRANPTCASCHSLMDPLGLALENFNAIGQYRTIGDAGEQIDATGGWPDGTTFEGVDGLRAALLDSDMLVLTLTEKLMTYATGRGVEAFDMPAIRAIVRDAGSDGYRLSDLITGVVRSDAFRQRMTATGAVE